MSNNALCEAMSKIFSGKGGSVRFAIFGISLLGIIGAIVESNYSLEGSTSDGKAFTLKPSAGVPSEDNTFASTETPDQENAEPIDTTFPSE